MRCSFRLDLNEEREENVAKQSQINSSVGKSQRLEVAGFVENGIVENDIRIAVYSTIIAEDGLHKICILLERHHRTVILTDSCTGGRGLGCAVDKAL